MNNASKWIAGGILCVALAGPAIAQNFLDDMIYSAKCSGADDKDACKVKAKQDFENSRQGANGERATSNRATVPQASSIDSADVCKRREVTGPIDVDTAYIRAMKKFHFTTQEEFDSQVKFSGGIVNPNFKHVKTPGVMYDLWDFIDVPGFHGIRPVAGLQLSKAGTKGTLMEVEYCLPHNHRAVANQAFWDAADTAFRNLVM